jgi:hypothetical protein
LGGSAAPELADSSKNHKKHDNSVILHKNTKFCVFIAKVGKILKESVFGGDGPPKTIEIP